MTDSEIIFVVLVVCIIAFVLSIYVGRLIGSYAKVSEWIRVDEVDIHEIYICKHCHCQRRHKSKYCDECGWLMENADGLPADGAAPENKV